MIKKDKKSQTKTRKIRGKSDDFIQRLIHRISIIKKGFFKKRWLKFTLILSFCIFFVMILTLLFFYINLPDLNSVKATTRKAVIRINDEFGHKVVIVGNIYGDSVQIENVSPYLKEAVIRVEDRRFYSHFGIDILGVLRAIYNNLKSGYNKEGGSTITQQLAKNLFLTPERTFRRKIKEAMLAFKLEYLFTKDEILEIYLNRVYFGSGVYGIDSAARKYYGKSSGDLNLYESAVLAGMLKAPNGYNPVLNKKKSMERARLVLKVMGKDADKVLYSAPIVRKDNNGGYFIDFIVGEVEGFIGDLNKDVEISSSYSPYLQTEISKIVERRVKEKEMEVAVIAMSYNGEIKAMVGGVNYNKSKFNRAVQAKRQEGSTFKPFVYLAGFETGLTEYDLFEDQPMKKLKVENYTKKHYGTVSLDYAFSHSLNTIAVKVAEEAGYKKVRKIASKFGVDASCVNSPILALGVCGTSLLNMTSAYASIANGGYLVNPYAINSIDSEIGNIYKRELSEKVRISKSEHVRMLDNMLFNVIKNGTGKKADPMTKIVKGKTGTTQNGKDAWFIGYDDALVVGVWVGFDDERHANITGGGLPSEIFKEIMEVN